jgi:putative serine protease PepD
VSDNWSDRPPWSSPGGTPPSTSTDPWAQRSAGTQPGPGGVPPVPPPPGASWQSPRPPAGYPTAPPLGAPPGAPPPAPAQRKGGPKVALVLLAAMCLVLAGLSGGLLLNRNTSRNVGSVTAALTAGTLPEDPAAAVAKVLGAAVVQLDTESGLGSGVVYDPSGLILTNAHVVGTSRELDVHFDNGRSAVGQVLGSDPEADVAVVKIDEPNVVAARLDDDKVAVGQMAIAIGSPFGLDQSVTAGIVSAVDRPVPGNNDITINMIQTDAPINPGNSGGALANRLGEVIGINTSIYSQNGENSGIGFAIPIQTAKTVADKIVNGEPLDHGWLGVSSSPPDDGNGGAQVSDVNAGSPADQAGLQTGDVVVAVDDGVVKSPQDLSARVLGHSPGDKVKLKVRRGTNEQVVEATLGKRPSTTNSKRRTRPTTTTTR